MKWIFIIIAVGLPCAVVTLFMRLEFASAIIITFALIAVLFFASLPWTAGWIYDHWRTRGERPVGGTVVKGFEDQSPSDEQG